MPASHRRVWSKAVKRGNQDARVKADGAPGPPKGSVVIPQSHDPAPPLPVCMPGCEGHYRAKGSQTWVGSERPGSVRGRIMTPNVAHALIPKPARDIT